MVPKTPEIAGKDFCQPEQCRRNSGGAWRQEQWWRVGSRAAAGEDQQASRSGSSPSSLLARTGGASPSHLQSKPTQTIPALFFSDLPRPLLGLLRCRSAATAHPLLPCSMYWQQGVLEAGDRRWRRSAAAAGGRSVGTAEGACWRWVGFCPSLLREEMVFCSWRGKSWVCGCRCWRRAAADRLKEMTKVLPRRCRVWAAGSLVRTGLLVVFLRCCCSWFLLLELGRSCGRREPLWRLLGGATGSAGGRRCCFTGRGRRCWKKKKPEGKGEWPVSVFGGEDDGEEKKKKGGYGAGLSSFTAGVRRMTDWEGWLCLGEKEQENGAGLREEEDAGTGWRGKNQNRGGRLLFKKRWV